MHNPDDPYANFSPFTAVSKENFFCQVYLYRMSDIDIRRRISISDVGYLYRTSDIYIGRRISISDVGYRYRTSDIDQTADIDTGCRI